MFERLQEYKAIEEIDSIENTILRILKDNQAQLDILNYLEPMVCALANLKVGTTFTILDLLPEREGKYPFFFLTEIENMFIYYLDSVNNSDDYSFMFFCQKTLLSVFFKY